MSSHAIRDIELTCDYPNCRETYNGTEQTIHAARRFAKLQGWTSFNGEFGRLDLCPEHSK